MSSADTRQQVRDRLKAALVAAQQQRGARQGIVDDHHGPELGWVIHERTVMTETANAILADLGAPPLTADDIYRAESLACGHSDYTLKYVLGVADLIQANATRVAQQ